ncbi:MAG: aminoacetone oxidase family FAD-binding enzyme [Clostridiales bacterium]|nr:aminoacetone oxidase family FAD-binding enzyme [Clostridiales bacterium]
MKKRVGIIGGGASGLFAACQLRRLSGGSDIEVTVLEKNSVPGKKLILTGHGRCNITNRKDVNKLKEGYHDADKFLYPALREFGPEDTVRLFENEIGLKTKEEDNNRIFPVCDSAVTVRDRLVSYISGSTKTVCDCAVKGIRKTTEFEVDTAKGKFTFDYLILSCGGSSFPKTGSTGDSYRFAKELGHDVIPVRGALAPLKAADKDKIFCKNLSGVPVNARVSLYSEGKKAASKDGELLFAEFGVTGPAVMEISREVPKDINGKDVYLELDLVPSMSDEEFDKELQSLIDRHADTKITTLLAKFVPQSVASEISSRAGAEGLYAQGFTKENRKNVCREIKHLKISLADAVDINIAYVTRGGVPLKEVDRKTMESKVVPGLYILGEALDIDGISGGYNLQACMSEAYLASKNILNSN